MDHGISLHGFLNFVFMFGICSIKSKHTFNGADLNRAEQTSNDGSLTGQLVRLPNLGNSHS